MKYAWITCSSCKNFIPTWGKNFTVKWFADLIWVSDKNSVFNTENPSLEDIDFVENLFCWNEEIRRFFVKACCAVSFFFKNKFYSDMILGRTRSSRQNEWKWKVFEGWKIVQGPSWKTLWWYRPNWRWRRPTPCPSFGKYPRSVYMSDHIYYIILPVYVVRRTSTWLLI